MLAIRPLVTSRIGIDIDLGKQRLNQSSSVFDRSGMWLSVHDAGTPAWLVPIPGGSVSFV
jgi:hypothetical protein